MFVCQWGGGREGGREEGGRREREVDIGVCGGEREREREGGESVCSGDQDMVIRCPLALNRESVLTSLYVPHRRSHGLIIVTLDCR